MIKWIKSLDRVLKGEATRPAALAGGTIDLPAGGFSILLVALGVVYGGCMGTFALVSRWGGHAAARGLFQMAYSAVKVPMLFALTLLITFPSLYVFNALVGCRLGFATVMRLLLAALGVILAVLASVGTIVVFFSLCTSSYAFMVLLNVVVFAVAGLLGMSFLLKTLHRLATARAEADAKAATPVAVLPVSTPVPPMFLPPVDPVGRHVRTVFAIWVLVFGLIGSQMGWVLRPFIGAPNAPVSFFRPRDGNFFQGVGDKAAELASESTARPAGPAPQDSRTAR